MVRGLHAFKQKILSGTLALLFTATQFGIAISPFINTQTANAVPACTSIIDTEGANDESGQKDLTRMCATPNNATSLYVTWSWDDINWTGNNSGDACALFDTDGDGNANKSVCVTINGSPATQQIGSPRVFTCNDSRTDRCPNEIIVAGAQTTCTVNQSATDPFNGTGNNQGSDYPQDTVAECNVVLSDVGGATATLVDVCSFPSSIAHSDPSDCVVMRARAGKIEVVKSLSPTTNSGLFNLLVNGTAYASNVGNAGRTGEVVVSEGNHTVSETAGTNTSLANYTSSISCRDQNGSGNVIKSGTGASLAAIPVADGADIVCIITNTLQQASLILQKTVTNDDGGTLTSADFPVAINSTTAQWGTNTVSPGSYTVSETQQQGYGASVWGGDCDSQGNVTLANNETKTCTITNNDIAPQLTVIKNVTNDNGGAAVASDFTMNITGTDVSNGSFAGSGSPGTTVTLDAGSYSVAETGPTGYVGTFSADCSGSIAIGQTKTCTVTNDDTAPQLTLVKSVTNDNGGGLTAADFTLHLAGGIYTGNENFSSGTSPTVRANVAYTVSETTIPSYTNTGIGCIDNVTELAVAHPVTLSAGQNVTCTVSNDDIAPRLTVTKVVANDDGGELEVSDFPLFVGNVSVTSGVTYTSFQAGQYTISETEQAGYTLSGVTGQCLLNGSITITLVVGGVYTCTLTNDDQPAQITVTKVVTNNAGGTAEVSDFDLYVNQSEVVSGVTNTFDSNQSYTISETTSLNGYSQVSITCVDAVTSANLGSTFTPAPGQLVNCTVQNDDNGPTLTLSKSVIDSTNAPVSGNEWTLTATPATNTIGAGVESGDGNPTDGGGVSNRPVYANIQYTLTESGPTGYSASNWVCSDGSLSGNVLTLALGDTAICTITNTRLANLTVVKDSTPADAQDFDFTVSDQPPGTFPSPPSNYSTSFALDDDSDVTLADTERITDLQPGVYYITEAVTSGWDLDEIDCGRVTSAPVNDQTVAVTVPSGADITCTFTNIKRGSITIIKDAQPNSSQEFRFTGSLGDPDTTQGPNFTLTDDGTGLPDNQRLFSDLTPGTYTVTEPNIKGWELESVLCVGGIDANENNRSAVINLAPGENVTCTFTNTAIPPQLTVIKNVINDSGGNQLASDFTMHVEGSNVSTSDFPGDETGTTVTLDPGVYEVSEDGLPGYTASLSPDCTGTLELGDEKTCTITNDDNTPLLTIQKTNNRPEATTVGDTVTYSLVVTVPEESGVVHNSVVTDLPPDNFTYLSGSWTATSSVETHNVAADITEGSPTGEPTYGSPGDWFLGRLLPGEVVTLTYRALILPVVSPGSYPDIAFVKGTSNSSTQSTVVLGNTSFSGSPFVSTQVSVLQPLAETQTFTAGQVLGASTLVNTGVGLSLRQFVIPSLLILATLWINAATIKRGEWKGARR